MKANTKITLATEKALIFSAQRTSSKESGNKVN
jgi:hypothetical protein